MNNLVVVGIIVVLAALVLFKIESSQTKYMDVKIKNFTVKAEVTDTIFKQMKGLMFREQLKEKEGMIFIFDRDDYHSFWMMNVTFPLDMVWIDAEKKIVHMEKNLRPCLVNCKTYTPSKQARYVLEVIGGFADKHKIKIGDGLDFSV